MHYINIFFFITSISVLISCNTKEDINQNPEPIGSTKINVLNDDFEDTPIVIAGNKGRNFIVSYERTIDGTTLFFKKTTKGLPIVMEDEEGTLWDIFGRGIEGPRAGQALTPTHSFMGYWFAFGALFPGTEIYEGEVKEGIEPGNPAPDWLIPTNYVFQGAGLDAIKSVDNPSFINFDFRDYTTEDFYVSDKDLVIGLNIGGEARAYPHNILNWHEIINDEFGGEKLSIIYCPLTGTASIWDRNLANGLTTFGVSGLLYNNNIIAYDRSTESLWTQLDGTCVRGELIGEKAKRYTFIETSWATWNLLYDMPKVVSDNTGVNRDYSQYPYGDYRTNHNFISYPILVNDNRLPSKERVHGIIIENKAKVYRFLSFQ
jgi:hypothetical protein